MEEMIDAIRAAVAEGATPEAKTSGVRACRTIAAALEAEGGKPITLPGIPATNPLAGILSPPTLDLLIAHLRNLADDRDKQRAAAATAAATAPAAPELARVAPERSGVRFAMVPPPRPRSRPPNSGRPVVRRK